MSVSINCIGLKINTERYVPAKDYGSQSPSSLVYVVECEGTVGEVYSKSNFGKLVEGRVLQSIHFDPLGIRHTDDVYETVSVRNVIDADECRREGVHFFMFVGDKVVRIRAFPAKSFKGLYDLVNDKDVSIHFTIAEWTLKKIARQVDEIKWNI